MIIMWIAIPDIVLKEIMVLAKAGFHYPPTYSHLLRKPMARVYANSSGQKNIN